MERTVSIICLLFLRPANQEKEREKERERDNFNSECAVNEEYRQLGEFLPWKKIVRERNRELLALSLSLKTSSQTIRSN